MSIYIVRHGITDACGLEPVNGKKPNKDVPLSETGREQILETCQYIPQSVTKIYTSPTLRTLETADIIKTKVGLLAPILSDHRLKNKVESEDASYQNNIKEFLHDILPFENIVIVTHGRIIKMLYSLINQDVINVTLMNSLTIGYGDVFVAPWKGSRIEMEWKPCSKK
jgi:broad specificity phosphatase PhoE